MPANLLADHRQHVPIGGPLPFDVFDGDGRLLLARGQRVQTESQLEALIRREARVGPAGPVPSEAPATTASTPAARRIQAWDRAFDRAREVLGGPVGPGFGQELDSAAQPLLDVVERDPELAIFNMVRPSGDELVDYASRHAIHAAMAAHLAAERLGWSADDRLRGFRAALTMNVSMVALQNRLAVQPGAVTPEQRDEIRSHPDRSADMLADAGITDADWLRAVRDHHEYGPERQGYPRGMGTVGELAMLVQRADVFTAKFAGRGTRRAMAADQAARTQFAKDRDSPMSAALIKEFGLYPPGTCVRLKSGEVAVVVKRGASAATPVVVSVTDARGQGLPEPVRRDTGVAVHAVAQIVPTHQLRLRVPLEALLAHTD